MQSIESTPLLDDAACVCRHFVVSVRMLAVSGSGHTTIIERPTGTDAELLRTMNLDTWDAYESIHLLMPDGSMKVGREAVAEVFRKMPHARWLAWAFAVDVYGIRPFQLVLNAGYAVLSDVRPIFGCESCSTQSSWLKPMAWTAERAKALTGGPHRVAPAVHFTSKVRR